MERKHLEQRGPSAQWGAADDYDLKGTDMEAADELLDWDPWWPVTVKPRERGTNTGTRRANGGSTGGPLELVQPQAAPEAVRSRDDLTVETAILKAEGVLIAATNHGRGMRRDHILDALTGLASALRTPRRSLEELVYEVGTTSAWSSLLQIERRFGQLADRVEDLAVHLEGSDPAEARPPVREILRRAKGLLAEETGAMVDIYWLDAGVVD